MRIRASRDGMFVDVTGVIVDVFGPAGQLYVEVKNPEGVHSRIWVQDIVEISFS